MLFSFLVAWDVLCFECAVMFPGVVFPGAVSVVCGDVCYAYLFTKCAVMSCWLGLVVSSRGLFPARRAAVAKPREGPVKTRQWIYWGLQSGTVERPLRGLSLEGWHPQGDRRPDRAR